MTWLRPAAETGLGLDGLGRRVKTLAALARAGLEVGQGLEVLVGDRLVDQRPEPLGRLELRAAERQMDEAQALRHG